MHVTQQTFLRWVAGLAAAALVCFLLWYFRSVVVYILVSAVLAIMGRPLVKALSRVRVRRWRVPRWLAALVTLIVMWVIIVALCALVVPLVLNKIYELSSLDLHSVMANVQGPLQHIQERLSELLVIPESQQLSISEVLTTTVRDVLSLNAINTAVSSVVEAGTSMVVMFFSVSFITFFFMKEDGLFYSMVTAMFPTRYQENVTRALDKITVLLSRYFTGLLTESLILMVVISITMIAFGMRTENACFIGIIMGVMNVIPYAGPLMGGIASLFIGIVTPIDGLTIGHTVAIIACSLIVIKGIDDFVLQPTIYSERVKAHPLEVFLVILLAGSMAGIVGMLLAIPSYTVLRVFAKEFFSQFTLVQKLTENV